MLWCRGVAGELPEREPDYFELVLALEQVHDIHYPTPCRSIPSPMFP